MVEEQQIFVTRSFLPSFEEYTAEISALWASHWLTNMGEKHKAFQSALETYLHVDHIELLVNGHMAIELTLQAMQLKGEVITTPFTFASTTHAIVRNGLMPVFCDIDPDDYTMDTARLESLITDKTCAIVPVHVYGNVCRVEEIDQIAAAHGLKVVYDAAHTFGETYKGRSVVDYGDAACLSFHATKVFHTIEGGAVCYRDESLGKTLYNLKNFGIRGLEHVESVGANAKMNEFCAAMGLCNLRHIEAEIARRQTVVERYRTHLSDVAGLKLNPIQQAVRSNAAYFPVLFDEKRFGVSRDEVFLELQRHNIYTRKYFYPLTNNFACFRGRFDVNQTPVARRVARQVLTLPLYADLPLEDVDRICRIIRSLKR